jgi:hypothetical protein
MSVGVMKDQKVKLRNLRASHTLGCSLEVKLFFFSGNQAEDSDRHDSTYPSGPH